MIQLSISIAAYNNAYTIGPLIEESIAVASKLTNDYEIFVIDDGSRDDTVVTIQQKVNKYPRVRLFRHDQNKGIGITIREAYTLPSGNWVFFVPGDNQISPAELLKLYPFRDQYDLILGHRRHRRDPWNRKFNSYCYNIIISCLIRKRIRDVDSVGFLRKEIFSGVTLRSESAFIHAEILLEVLKNNGRVFEADIDHKPREFGSNSGGNIKTIFRTVRDMLTYLTRR